MNMMYPKGNTSMQLYNEYCPKLIQNASKFDINTL